uniref:Aminotransferase-like plant mobile domain-containing protein n=1 Tax=Setaria italica TaxID=4555 RepID=K4AIP7_SETIT
MCGPGVVHICREVEWTPYTHDQLSNIAFSPMCYRDMELWRSTTPLILYYVVEMHLLHRVMWQFGRAQQCPPMEYSTLQALHKIDRKKRYKENDWRQRCDPRDGSYWHAGPHKEYLRWYYVAMRTRIKPAWTTDPIENPSSDDSDDIADETASASTAPVRSSRSQGKAPATPEPNDPTYGEHFEMSNMFDAPPVTQTQGESSQVVSPVSPSCNLNC